MLKKVNKATPTAATFTKPQGQIEKTTTTNLAEVVASGARQGTVRVVVSAKLSANYNAVGVEVGGEIPFTLGEHGDEFDEALAEFQDNFDAFYEKVEGIVDDKLEEMRKVLTEVGKK